MLNTLPSITAILSLRCDALPPQIARRSAAGLPIHIVLPTAEVAAMYAAKCRKPQADLLALMSLLTRGLFSSFPPRPAPTNFALVTTAVTTASNREFLVV